MSEINRVGDFNSQDQNPQLPQKSTVSKVFSIAGKVLYYIVIGIVVAVVAASLYSVIASKIFKQKVPMVFGYAYLLVETDSMKGDKPDSFPGHTLIVIKAQDEYKVDDIVTFDEGGKHTTTHRIVREINGQFITKGDGNNVEDNDENSLLPPDKIFGKVIWDSQVLGKLLVYASKPFGIIFILLIGFLLIYLPTFFENSPKQTVDKH